MDKPSHNESLFILENAPMGLIITDSTGAIIWCNKTLAAWLGAEAETYLGQEETALIHTGSSADAIIGNGRFLLESGLTLERKQVTLLDGQQAIYYLDVTEEEALRQDRLILAQQLEYFDTMEPISGLLNHQAICKSLDPLVSRSRRYQNPLSLVTMEITTFNDLTVAHGQAAADLAVLSVSQLLRDHIRWADLLGHLGNGKFIFVLPETNQAAAVSLASKIGDKLNQLQIGIGKDQTIALKACFGVASWAKGDDTSSLLSRSAEAAQTAWQNGDFAIEAA